MDITSFWERIKILCKQNDITQQELSEKLGYGNRNLAVKIARNSFPNIEEVKKISEIFKVSFDYLINGDDTKTISNEPKFFVPVLNQKLSAGFGQLVPDTPEVAGYMEVPRYLRYYGENLGLLYIIGDSMEPTLRRGDLVLCDSCGYDGEGLYAVRYCGDFYAKRILKKGDKYIIISDNKSYPLLEEPVASDDISIVGRVHYIIKKCD